MAALGVPTTRCLAIIATNKPIQRRAEKESAAVTTRFSPSWIRFGTFELFHYRGEADRLRELADFCIRYHYSYVELDANFDNAVEIRLNKVQLPEQPNPAMRAQSAKTCKAFTSDFRRRQGL